MLMLHRVSVQTPFHVAALQSLLQLLGTLAQQEIQQQEVHREEHWQHVTSQTSTYQVQRLHVASIPNVYHTSDACGEAHPHNSALAQLQQQQPVEQKLQDYHQPSPRDLLLQLRSFCQPATPTTAAAALHDKAAHSSIQHVNRMLAKQIVSHDGVLLESTSHRQMGKGKKHKRKKQGRPGQKHQQQQCSEPMTVKPRPEHFALLRYVKLSLEALTHQHMLELTR
jgi:hypothetical protein